MKKHAAPRRRQAFGSEATLLGTVLLAGAGHNAQAQVAVETLRRPVTPTITDTLRRQRLPDVVVTANRTATGRCTLAVLANNLTDENYYEKRGYNLPGRNLTGRAGRSRVVFVNC